jgi:hypothetical protein
MDIIIKRSILIIIGLVLYVMLVGAIMDFCGITNI